MNFKIKKPWVRDLLSVLLAISISLIFALVLTLILSEDPKSTFITLLTGPGTKMNRIGDWIEEVITLTLVGLSVTILFKGKIFSLLPPANMIVGSLMGGLVMLYSPLPPTFTIILGILVGGIAGGLLSLIPAYLHLKWKTDLVVTTLMLNVIVLRLNFFLILQYLRVVAINVIGSAEFDRSLKVPSAFNPSWGEVFEKLNRITSISIFLYIAIFLSIVMYIIIYHTKFGYKIRMIGENYKFATYTGIQVNKNIYVAMVISGFIAGLAGVNLSFVMHNRILGDPTSGFGLTGFLVSTMAQNNPLLVPISALFYGFLRVGGDIMERTTDLSREMVMLIQGVMILMVSAEGIIKTVTKRAEVDEDNLQLTDEDNLQLADEKK